jgi:predicted nucleotidyltransferase
MRPEVCCVLDELREGLTTLYGDRLVKVVLYGSQARGDATDDSDIDVLLVLRGPFHRAEEMKRTSRLVGDLSLKYDTLVSRQFMSDEDYRCSHTPLLLNVRREGAVV